ncbi:MAG: type II secretion system F family protein [Alphaproteobacteria bacterium]
MDKIIDLLLNSGGGDMIFSLGVFAAVLLVASAFSEKNNNFPARLKALEERRALLKAEFMRARNKQDESPLMAAKKIGQMLRGLQGNAADEVRKRLLRAGFRKQDAVSYFLFAQVAMPFAFGGVAALLLYGLHVGKLNDIQRSMIFLASLAVGGLAPSLYIKNCTEKRLDKIKKGMADAMDLLVICAEAGLSLDSSFLRVGKELGSAYPELSDEVQLTSIELGFMPDRQQAVMALAERVPLPAIRALVATLIQTERFGTPLAQALRVLSAETRNERIMKAEEKAAKLPAMLTMPMVGFILPPLFIVLLGPAILKVMEVFSRKASGSL